MTSISGNPNDLDRKTWPKKSALDVAALVASFIPNSLSVAPEAYQARLDVCAGCIYRTAGTVGFRCAACGCFVAVKAALRAFHCPQLKWEGDT